MIVKDFFERAGVCVKIALCYNDNATVCFI
jgi:hypothetical protein